MYNFHKSFCKGFLIGTTCICALAIVWLLLFRPCRTRNEAQRLKDTYAQDGPGANNSGAFSVPDEWPQAALDLTALQMCYPDIKAWLTIPGTVVDYPVLQSSPKNPEYYLRRNYRSEYRMAGSLFFQADCTFDSRCLVIYGHNMSDGTMLGCLPNYLDTDYCREHGRITLETPDGISEYSVAAVLETDVSRVPFNRTAFADDADFLAFAQSLLDVATVKTGVPITVDSKLLVLVTCSYSWPDARYVIVAVQNITERCGANCLY